MKKAKREITYVPTTNYDIIELLLQLLLKKKHSDFSYLLCAFSGWKTFTSSPGIKLVSQRLRFKKKRSWEDFKAPLQIERKTVKR